MIYICDLDTMEKVGKQDKFSFRQVIHREGVGELFDWLHGYKETHLQPGIIGSSGKNWQEQRRFALQHLKDFGLGKGC